MIKIEIIFTAVNKFETKMTVTPVGIVTNLEKSVLEKFDKIIQDYLTDVYCQLLEQPEILKESYPYAGTK